MLRRDPSTRGASAASQRKASAGSTDASCARASSRNCLARRSCSTCFWRPLVMRRGSVSTPIRRSLVRCRRSFQAKGRQPDPTISRLLKLSAEELSQARSRLHEAELALYRYPLYQVLPLPAACANARSSPRTSPPPTLARGGEPMSLREVFALLGRQGQDEECRRSPEP